MPAIGVAVLVAAGTAAAGVALGTVTVGAAIASVALTATAAGVSAALTPRETEAAEVIEAAPGNSQRDIAIRQATPPRRFVYGTCRTAGVVFFQDNKNPNLIIGTLISDGEIDAIVSVFFGDKIIAMQGLAASPDTIYANKFSIETALGADSQTASVVLTSEFSVESTFRQRGVARVVATLVHALTADEQNTLWSASVTPVYLVRGVKMYDPRIVGSSFANRATWAYSDNPALCVAHAITNVWQNAIPDTAIDWASVTAAANICDATGFKLSGVFEAGTDMAAQIAAMLASMRGSLVYRNGLYRLYADTEKTSVWTITDNDILAVNQVTHDIAANERYGSISASYFDATAEGRESTTPAYIIDAAERSLTADFSFCSNATAAQILAYRTLVSSRASRTIQLTVTDAGIYLDPFVDLVTLTTVEFAFLNGSYVVQSVDLTTDGVALVLREYDPATYNDPVTYLETDE